MSGVPKLPRVAEIRRSVRQAVIRHRQRLARRLDPFVLEQLYQTNYLEVAGRTPWLHDPPLSSPGGGTASFSQLYVLLILLRDGGFHRVLELGVGKSTELLQQWAGSHDAETSHVDDNAGWLEATVKDRPGSTRIHAPLAKRAVLGHDIEWYGTERPPGKFDLVLVDGPQAWHGEARYNRLGVLNWLPDILAEDFVLVVDDASRRGEQALVRAAEQRLRASRSGVMSREVIGSNSQVLLATPRYRWAAYL